jgi:regulator of sigma E protease
VLTTLISFLVVIGVLVFVHELGHLIAAKSVDIECPRFSIGFGPRIAGFQWGETEYVISLLPLGGYVRMAGMEDTAALEGGAEPDHVPSDRDFDSKPLWARIWVVTAGVIMNFLFAILVITGVSLGYGEQVNTSTRIAVAPGAALTGATAPLSNIPVGATVVAVGDEQVSDWNAVVDALSTAPAGPVTLRFSDAAPVTFDLPAGETARLPVLGALQPFSEPVIGEVSPNTPAARGGLRSGDRIESAGGQPMQSWTEFVQIVRRSPARPLSLVVLRDGQRVPLTVTPESRRETAAEPGTPEIGWLGVAARFDLERRHMGIGEAFQRGVDVTWSTASSIVKLLGDLFTGKASPRSLGGPLTIGQISGETARQGMEVMLSWMALLSVNLAVLNLLPIPVLDGGQLLFLLVEGVRGRPLSIEQRLRLSHVGLILVVGIMVWAITNDFLRLFGI